jgi:hypothetical protein
MRPKVTSVTTKGANRPRLLLMLWLLGGASIGCSFWSGPEVAQDASVPAPNPTAKVTRGVSYQTLGLGSAAELLCLPEIVSGRIHGYMPGGSTDAMDAVIADGGCTADTCASGFLLYVDDIGMWELYTEGAPFSVSVACVPWSSFGLAAAPIVARKDNASSFAPQANRVDLGGMTCALSSAEGGNGLEGGVAEISDGGYVVTGGGTATGSPSALWSSAVCFGDVAFVDVPLSAGGTKLPAAAFCGLSALGDMTAEDSTVDVSSRPAKVVDATATARCFPYQALAGRRDAPAEK